MEWTFDEFFADGGTVSFMDRVAGSLGIHASSIKIVSVYEGSLVVNYEITDPNDNVEVLETIKSKQTDLYATNKMSVGAPILDVAISLFNSKHTSAQAAKVETVTVVNGGVVAAPGYTPIVIHRVSQQGQTTPLSFSSTQTKV